MITSNELELKTTLSLGSLESNADAIKEFVQTKLQEYKPENYIGKADEAKADRAVLNAAEKTLNAKRLELERSYMEPFNKFKITINEACKLLKTASAGLDEIVKGEEERERQQKHQEIEKYWNGTGFSLFPLERVDNPKWTNKTTKLKDVYKEIDGIHIKTFNDLKILEQFPAEDVALLKTVYLDTLDLPQVMAKAESLKQNRERLAREKVEREQIETQKQLHKQSIETRDDLNAAAKSDAMADMVSEALGLEIDAETPEAKEDYALILHGTRDALLEVRRFLTKNQVTYTKLECKGNGVYTAE